MRFITVASLAVAAASVAASPYAAPNYGGNIAQIIGSPLNVPIPPVVGYPVPAYPGGGAGNGSNGNGSNGNGSNGNGSNGSGSNGSGSNGSGSSGSGSNGSGSNGQVGDPSNCGLKPGQKAALTPLVEELKLTRTVDDLKHLTKQITDLLGDTLQEDATTSILKTVDNLVAGLGLGGLDLKPAVDSVTSILRKQVPCLLDTLLPKP
ncbi:hypothetical protein LPJ78_002021 [Coemansia sp. RSA 989]|nr:hypothetical protein LPJ68_003053 [Coemansia sp. RSA 1086]KAJ1751529.1 hypothetical protein LPJ79_002008 [Coemansia sp. RSA 1821]KAJ1866199.1 hypothetical protein LPJ78_002021 [Coemansia sp. RSA 989]KAJ1873428.1 hypothetical protein LPJ55_002282 [Coemansia sp. RSA 990]KAJ2633317.1 hypothetical protein H4R22_000602 [Coemansia sp. RSA 1290]KAJ2647970.1 hypothetical protein IWW40_004294 [Coemansia sp. RSA 1250]KAJ2670018.1 hypothetical protein IWW42_004217 [Coemansia sp. RSA 1085]